MGGGTGTVQEVKELQIESAKISNEHLYQTVRTSSRFRGFASLPTLSPAAAAEELERSIKEYGFVGGFIFGKDNVSYHSSEYDLFWQKFEELDVPLYIHEGKSSGATDPTFLEENPMLAGTTWDAAVGVADLVLDLIMNEVFVRHPNLKIILGHMGELIPFWASRLDHRVRITNGGKYATSARVQETLRHNIWVTVSGFNDTPALQHLLSVVGVDRVLFATDFPHENATTARLWFEDAMGSLGLSEKEKAMLMSGNAKHLLQTL